MNKRQQILSQYVMKGILFKAAGESLDKQGLLDGVLCGLAGETLEDETVNIFQIKRGAQSTTVSPWKVWKAGEVEDLDGGNFSVEFVVPEGRSQGVFVSKRNRVLVPLRV